MPRNLHNYVTWPTIRRIRDPPTDGQTEGGPASVAARVGSSGGYVAALIE